MAKDPKFKSGEHVIVEEGSSEHDTLPVLRVKKDKGEKTPKRGFPIIGDDSVIPIRIMTLSAFVIATVGGAIYITNLNNKVDRLGDTCTRIEENFNELVNAMGYSKYGKKTP